ncbi:MAG: secretory protein [Frankiales bacterium]|nr:secretory protein [Frankiales bacterium]
MLARIRKAQENNEGGFTLIELLVVMIIIGILAAIAIPAFLSQKQKAKDTSAKSDVSTIGKEVAAYYVDGTGTLSVSGSSGTWTLSGTGLTTAITGKLSDGNSVGSSTITSDAAWCVAVTSGGTSPKTYSYSATNGLKNNGCTGTGN